MARRNTPGLYKDSSGYWRIDKMINGARIHKDTHTKALKTAEAILEDEIDRLQKSPDNVVTFRTAAIHYLSNTSLSSDTDVAYQLSVIFEHIGDSPLPGIRRSSLEPLVNELTASRVKTSTINSYLSIVDRVLGHSLDVEDENGEPWLLSKPRIKKFKCTDARLAYPLSWDEQDLLLPLLPGHLNQMALFMLNTGVRDKDICGLQWTWERKVPGSYDSYFIVPGHLHKNRKPRIIVLNSIARSIIESLRASSRGCEHVFTYQGRPISRMNNNGWRSALRQACGLYERRIGQPLTEGFSTLHVHDLKHTFGRRLRAAGVSERDMADLLGHYTGKITDIYTEAEYQRIANIAELVAVRPAAGSPTLSQLRIAG